MPEIATLDEIMGRGAAQDQPEFATLDQIATRTPADYAQGAMNAVNPFAGTIANAQAPTLNPIAGAINAAAQPFRGAMDAYNSLPTIQAPADSQAPLAPVPQNSYAQQYGQQAYQQIQQAQPYLNQPYSATLAAKFGLKGPQPFDPIQDFQSGAGTFSRLTGDPRYFAQARQAAVLKQLSVPQGVIPETGGDPHQNFAVVNIGPDTTPNTPRNQVEWKIREQAPNLLREFQQQLQTNPNAAAAPLGDLPGEVYDLGDGRMLVGKSTLDTLVKRITGGMQTANDIANRRPDNSLGTDLKNVAAVGVGGLEKALVGGMDIGLQLLDKSGPIPLAQYDRATGKLDDLRAGAEAIANAPIDNPALNLAGETIGTFLPMAVPGARFAMPASAGLGAFTDIKQQYKDKGYNDEAANAAALPAGATIGAINAVAQELLPGAGKRVPGLLNNMGRGALSIGAYSAVTAPADALVNAAATGQPVDWSKIPGQVVGAAVLGALTHAFTYGFDFKGRAEDRQNATIQDRIDRLKSLNEMVVNGELSPEDVGEAFKQSVTTGKPADVGGVRVTPEDFYSLMSNVARRGGRVTPKPKPRPGEETGVQSGAPEDVPPGVSPTETPSDLRALPGPEQLPRAENIASAPPAGTTEVQPPTIQKGGSNGIEENGQAPAEVLNPATQQPAAGAAEPVPQPAPAPVTLPPATPAEGADRTTPQANPPQRSGGINKLKAGKVFGDVVAKLGRDDVGEILNNWNESSLNEDGTGIKGTPFKRNAEKGNGPAVKYGKKEFLDWLASDAPFDEKVYGPKIKEDQQWVDLIARARKAAGFEQAPPAATGGNAPAPAEITPAAPVAESAPAAPTKTTYTTLPADWHGRKLEKPGTVPMLPKGETATGASGRKTRIMPPAMLDQFTTIDSRLSPLADAVRAKTGEIMQLPKGQLLVPKKAAEEARAELSAQGFDEAQAKHDLLRADQEAARQRIIDKAKAEQERAAKIQGIEDRLRELHNASLPGGSRVNSAQEARKAFPAEGLMHWARTQPNGSEAYLLGYLRDKATSDPKGTKYKWVEPTNLADGAQIKVGDEVMTVDHQLNGKTLLRDGITVEVKPDTQIPAREVVEPEHEGEHHDDLGDAAEPATPKNWLDSLGGNRESALAEMRNIRTKSDRYLGNARKLSAPGGAIEAGGGRFDETVRGEALATFLGAIGKGQTPQQAAETAKADAREWVSKWNAKRGKDFQTHRDAGTADSTIDDAMRSMLQAIPRAERAPTPQAEKYFNADEAGASGTKKGLFGQDVVDRATGDQGTMFDTSKPATPERLGSKNANDPRNTGKMFGEATTAADRAEEPGAADEQSGGIQGMAAPTGNAKKLRDLRAEIKTYREYEQQARTEGDQEGANNLARHISRLYADLERLSGSAQPAQGPKLATIPLQDFARVVQGLADKSERGFGSNKVFISDAYDAAKALDPSLTLDQFKSRLVDAHRADLLNLSRADLVAAMHPEDVSRSETKYLNGSFNFIQAADKPRTWRQWTPEEAAVAAKRNAEQYAAKENARPRVVGFGGSPKTKTVERTAPEKTETPTATSNPIKEALIGDRSFVGRDVKPTGIAVLKAIHEAADEIRAVFAPQTRSSEAKVESLMLREKGGELAQRTDRAEKALRIARAYFDKLGAEKSFDFIDKLEAGEDVGDGHLKEFGKIMRDLLDTRRKEVQDLGTGRLQNFIENYFPHIWQDPTKAKDILAQIVGRKPIEGTKSFLKQRTIPTFKAGIEAGLKPVSDNPVDLVLLKLREMDRYILAHRHLDDMMEHGLAKYVAVFKKAPEGWSKIDDSLFTVYGPPTVTVKEYVDGTVYDALEATATRLGIKHERLINAGRGRLGYSVQGGNKVVSQFGTGIQVLAHEIGHQLDHKYNLWENLLKRDSGKGHKPGRSELRDIAELTGSRAETGYAFKREEKIAQVLEAYMHARQRMEEVAPRVFKWFDNFVRNTPELSPLAEAMPSLDMKELENEKAHGGMLVMGHYYAPEPVARVINNHFTPGLRAKSGAFRALLGVNNTLNQAQLGFSFFHGGFTTMDAMVSQFAVGLQHLMAGRPIPALIKMFTAPAAPIASIWNSNKIIKEWFAPGSQGADIAKIVQSIVSAGGRVRQDPFYTNRIWDRMMTEIRKGNYLGASMRAPLALIEKAAAPVMEWYVPRMKLGLFMQQAQVELANLPHDASTDQIREALAGAWDSIDNRMGQVVYDNLFWDRTAKDLAMASTRSLGWNLGTWRELGGAVADTVGAAAAGGNRNWQWWKPKEQRGKTETGAPDAVFTRRMAYGIAAVVLTGLAGGLMQYLLTGKRPEEEKDYFFPKTGETDANGHPVRMSLPTYLKDVEAYRHGFGRTLGHKVSPVVSHAIEQINNEDYFGTKIRNEDDPFVKQVIDSVKHFGESLQPFSVRGYQQLSDEQAPAWKRTLPFVGVTQASPKLSLTPAETLADQLAADKMPRGGRTTEQAEKSKTKAGLAREMKADIQAGRLKRPDDPDNLDRSLVPAGAPIPSSLQHILDQKAAGNLNADDVREVARRSFLEPLAYRAKGLSVEDSMRVWRIASDTEKNEIKAELQKKIAAAKHLTLPQKTQFATEVLSTSPSAASK